MSKNDNSTITSDEQKLSNASWWRIMTQLENYNKYKTPIIDTLEEIDGSYLSSLREIHQHDPSLTNRQLLLRNCRQFMKSKARTESYCEYVIPEIIPGGTRIRNFPKVMKELCEDLNAKQGL